MAVIPASISDSTINALQAKFFRGFGDSSRLAILQALSDAPHTVGELATFARLSQPATSNHLSCLHDCGLVRRERQGKYVVYSLADQRIASLLALVGDLVSDHAAEVAACIHMDTPQRGRS